ncbi:MAG: AzlC family ABC transporter permease [Clostridia bacterium]|nr:AzlC family ABC transporter permease [Clostridia bacterium]
MYAIICRIEKKGGVFVAKNESPYRYLQGLKDGIPIGLGYLSVSFGFGISAVGEGLRVLEALIISMTNLTSAGQVAGVTVIVAGGTLLEMALTQLVINLRYSLMGITLTQRLDDRCHTGHRLLMSFGLTDEIFALAASKPYPVGPSYFYGLMTAPYIGWAGGTLMGALAGSILPENLRAAMGIMIYAMFVAIILPPMKQNRGVLLTVMLAAALSCCMAYIPVLNAVSDGFAIIICAVLAAVVMAVLRPISDGEEGAP